MIWQLKMQIKPDAKRQLDLYYQRACSYVQLGIAQGTNAVEVDYFERAVEDLKEIAKNPATDWINILKPFCKKGTKDKNGREIGDKDEGGDLYPLKSGDYASPTEQERLNRVRKEAQEIFDQFLAKKKFTN